MPRKKNPEGGTHLSIEFSAELRRVKGTWLAHAPAFQLTQDGGTEKEARALLIESVALYLSYAAQHGKLATVLRQCMRCSHRAGVQRERLHVSLPLSAVAQIQSTRRDH